MESSSMPQPSLAQLFGSNASVQNGELRVVLESLAETGLSTTNPLAIYAAIIKMGGAWLASNNDEAVMATCEISSFAPITRNNQDRTQYNYSLAFYGNYADPELDPDDL